jgi:hypothetical protein
VHLWRDQMSRINWARPRFKTARGTLNILDEQEALKNDQTEKWLQRQRPAYRRTHHSPTRPILPCSRTRDDV